MKGEHCMFYKSVVVDYSPKAKKMAAAIEEKANEMEKAGYELVTMAITGSSKAILVFKTDSIIEPEPEKISGEETEDEEDEED